jgi:hypothetical protein
VACPHHRQDRNAQNLPPFMFTWHLGTTLTQVGQAWESVFPAGTQRVLVSFEAGDT